ncbi:hypothetical protein [Pelagibius marinus]|uniref:hypothetical protein n=1 Tax=Pelagibius marinus TaxID=2762760 RepID=UPI0018721B75|nr:hypothetical protein [Pelagibius marinus]
MAKSSSKIDEKALTKGELRKLNALRKSIGDKLAEEAFSKWYAQQGKGNEAEDPNIEMLEKALNPLIKKLKIPRGGAYAVRRGRGRFIVEPVKLKD